MADSQVTPSATLDPSLADSKTATESATTPQEQSATENTNRPISTTLADSQTEAKPPLADSASDYTDYTEPKPNVAGSPEATESAATAPPSDTPLADSQSPSAPAESPSQPPLAETAPEPSIPSPPTPPEPISGGSMEDLSASNQPPQVQSEPQETPPSPSASEEPKITSESAEIKPEAPHGTQEAPLADSKTENPAKTTFGDLIGKTPAASPPLPVPAQAPETPPPAPASSFGDLLQGDKPEEPAIRIEPIEPPKSPPPPQPSQPIPKPEPVIEAKADFSSKRQQALQVRRKNREERLTKTLSLVAQKGKINNKQVVELLRVSQSTATNYLRFLVEDGKLKKEGKGKATKYFL